MTYVWMMAAFFLMTGMALLFARILRLNIGEGMILAASSIVLILYCSGYTGVFRNGIYIISVIGCSGYVFWIAGMIKERKKMLEYVVNPYYMILLLMLLYTMAAFYHDFIQHIDEFHQWAFAVKYMLENNDFPWNSGYLVGKCYGTSFFHLYFQEFTGYNESIMYGSSFILMWIGVLLPFSEFKKEDWKKPLFYTLILFFAIYSLYYYGTKNLYVDLATCGWAGGLAGWWMNRTKKKGNALVIISGLMMLSLFKPYVGILMVVYVAAYMVFYSLFIEKEVLNTEKRRKYGQCGVMILAVIIVVFCAVWYYALLHIEILPNFFQNILYQRIADLQEWKDKVFLTTGSFMTAFFGTPLASYSQLKITIFSILTFFICGTWGLGYLFNQRKKIPYFLVYFLGMGVSYCLVLFTAFLFIFGYEEGSNATGCARYFAICAIYLLIIDLVILFQPEEITVGTQQNKAGKSFKQTITAMVLLLIFVYGLNKNFIIRNTSWKLSEISGYEEIKNARSQIEKIQNIIGEDDKVYLLYQSGQNEYVTNTAFYYLDTQVSNYLCEPWRFTKEGSMIRIGQVSYPTLEDFPEVLRDGGYQYVWIFNKDQYLKENLPKVLKCDSVKNGHLYRVLYEDDQVIGLEDVGKM